jgi:hypothetical protein
VRRRKQYEVQKAQVQGVGGCSFCHLPQVARGEQHDVAHGQFEHGPNLLDKYLGHQQFRNNIRKGLSIHIIGCFVPDSACKYQKLRRHRLGEDLAHIFTLRSLVDLFEVEPNLDCFGLRAITWCRTHVLHRQIAKIVAE